MINFGIRQSFDSIDQVEERFSNLTVPVELVLPYYWNIYEPVIEHLAEITDKIKTYNIEVLSIHAVQAPITNERFRIWGKDIGDFAKSLGVKTINLHPNNVNRSRSIQEDALKNLEYFIGLYDGEKEADSTCL